MTTSKFPIGTTVRIQKGLFKGDVGEVIKRTKKGYQVQIGFSCIVSVNVGDVKKARGFN